MVGGALPPGANTMYMISHWSGSRRKVVWAKPMVRRFLPQGKGARV